MKTSSNYIYITIITLSFLFSCESNTVNNQNPETSTAVSNEITISKEQLETGGMKLGKMSSRVLKTTISTRGYIDVPPANRSAVSPYYGGYVQKIDVLPGQEVKKGALLFTLQNPEYLKMQQSYLEVKEQLDYLKADFERLQTLSDENIASQKNFKKAASDYRVMQAKYQGLKAQLKLMNISLARLEQGELTSTIAIYAPISGSITKVNTMKSAFINASEVALEIVNTDHIHLELEVFEKDAMNIKEHQKIIFTVPESGGQSYIGAVHLVGKSVDAQQRTIAVHGHISAEDEGLFIPGMYVNAEIEIGGRTSQCLPKSAVTEIEGIYYVLVQTKVTNDEMHFVQQSVTVLEATDDWIIIEKPEVLKDKILLTEGAFAMIGG